MTPRQNRIAMTALTVLLALGAVAYLAKGCYALTWLELPYGGIDLKIRWSEVHRLLYGGNPYPSPDPPWSFLQSILFMWPPMPYARFYFAAVNAAALAYIVYWTLTAQELRAVPRGLLIVSVLAMASIS